MQNQSSDMSLYGFFTAFPGFCGFAGGEGSGQVAVKMTASSYRHRELSYEVSYSLWKWRKREI